MGDRSNIFIQQQRRPDHDTWEGVGLYSHWGGERMQAIAILAADSSTARMRVGDEAYFTRIVLHLILHEMADPDSDAGFGIWTAHPCDNSYPILVINALTGEHWFADENSYRKDKPT